MPLRVLAVNALGVMCWRPAAVRRPRGLPAGATAGCAGRAAGSGRGEGYDPGAS